MEQEARSPALPDIASVAWKVPAKWRWPGWLPPEPCEASLPMHKDRFHWCLIVLGWATEELSRRIHTHPSSLRQMGRGKRDIPDTLAIYLEEKAAMMLNSPLEPRGWRAKPTRDDVWHNTRVSTRAIAHNLGAPDDPNRNWPPGRHPPPPEQTSDEPAAPQPGPPTQLIWEPTGKRHGSTYVQDEAGQWWQRDYDFRSRRETK